MRKINCTILISFILLSLLVTIDISTQPANAEADGYETNLTNDTLSQGNPAIHGERVVWTENTLEGGVENWEIFMCDLSLGSGEAKIRITNNASRQLNPEIYGDKIVWEDNRHGNFDIYMYDLTVDSDKDTIPNYLDEDDDGDGTPDVSDLDEDPAEIRITDNPSHQEYPAIYGNRIVWEDSRYGNKTVFIYEITSRKETLLAGLNEIQLFLDELKQRYPKISGNKVVWQDDRHGNIEIFMYNLSVDSDEDGVPNYLDDDVPLDDPAEVRITSNSKNDFFPSIFYDQVVYVRSNNTFLFDISTDTEYQLTNSTNEQKIKEAPCIHGKKVVWVYDVGSKDIYMYDLAFDSDNNDVPNYLDPDTTEPDDALARVTNESESSSMKPVIFINKIVWQDKRNSSKPSEIYMFTLNGNYPPEIVYRNPAPNPEIEENEWIIFDIMGMDLDGDTLTYSWFLDDIQVLEDTGTYNFTSDYDSAGTFEVKAVISDGEYHIEYAWTLQVTESDLPPFEITYIDPIINPTIVEGEEITFSILVKYFSFDDVNTSWTGIGWIDGFNVFDRASGPTYDSREGPFGEIDSTYTYYTRLDYDISNIEKKFNITVEITDGTNSISYTWTLTVQYFDDADMDGYDDATENTYGSDPLDISDTPPDLDGDFIVDGEDDDTDGDGTLDEHDAYPMDPNRQVSGKPDYSVEILIVIMALILVLAAVVLMPRVSKRRRR